MEKSVFHLNNTTMTSFEMSELVPFMYRETIPSDEFRGRSNAFIRAMPLVRPVMHKLDIYTRYFYIPYRLLSKDLRTMVTKPLEDVKFMSLYDYLEKRHELDRLDGIFSRTNKNLLTYFGISSSEEDMNPNAAKELSMLPFMAYYLVYNYYYLDPILDKDIYQDEFNIDDFVDIDLLKIRRVNRYNDYFTSARPSTQYGDEVSLDLDRNGSVKVSEMRLAERLQVWYERLLHNFEHRYNETLRGFYGVSPRDETLQRPLFLGGDKQILNIMDVDSTATFGNSPLATPAGKSVTNVNSDGWDVKITEHGIILGLSHILPRQSYICGIPAEFQRLTAADLHNPLFNNIGYQALKGSELDANRMDIFGYKERYAELKECKDVIASDMIFDNNWHLGLNIQKAQLNSQFIKAFPQNQAFATDDNEAISLAGTKWIYVYMFIGRKPSNSIISDDAWAISYRASFEELSTDVVDAQLDYLKSIDSRYSWERYLMPHPVSKLHNDISLPEATMMDVWDLAVNNVVTPNPKKVYYPSILEDSLYGGKWLTFGLGVSSATIEPYQVPKFRFVNAPNGSVDISQFGLYWAGSTDNYRGMMYLQGSSYSYLNCQTTSNGELVAFPRIEANTDASNNHFIGIFYNQTTAIRPLPKRVNTIYY